MKMGKSDHLSPLVCRGQAHHHWGKEELAGSAKAACIRFPPPWSPGLGKGTAERGMLHPTGRETPGR